VSPHDEAHSSSKEARNKDGCEVNDASVHAAGILQLGQFSSPQALLSAWQQQLLPSCQAAWGKLRADTQALLQQLGAAAQQQQQAWCPRGFLLKLDSLLGELQEVSELWITLLARTCIVEAVTCTVLHCMLRHAITACTQ
jgi:hypothetical protein